MSTDVHVSVEAEEEPFRHDSTAATSDKAPPPSKEESKLGLPLCIQWVVLLVDTTLVFFLVVLTLVIWILFGVNLIDVLESDTSNQKKDSPFYDRVRKVETTAKNYANRVKIIRSRLVIWLLTWLVVNLSVPGLKKKLVLGSELWKWTLLLSLISCGYSLISLASTSLLSLLCSNRRFTSNPNAEYYARGLRLSVNLVVLSLSVLLTWILYFKTSHGIRKTPKTKGLLHVGTWTFFMLVVAALLWLLKNVLLLLWEADVVYNRFKERILSAGRNQFFLSHLCDLHDMQRLELFWPKVGTEESDKPNTYHIQQMADHFVRLSVASSRDDDGTSLVSDKCKQFRPRETGVDKKDITADDLSKLLKEGNLPELLKDANLPEEEKVGLRDKYAKLWLGDLKRENELKEPEKISYENCGKTMVKAQKNCLALGHSLSDAKKVVKVLNKVMTALLGAIVMVAWLLLTDIATNKILVLMASPFLAATFIFGEACKRIFEGIMFSFISHPFDVGDLCIIDDKELEVRNMGILTTKFQLIGKKEEVLLYPNSILATKSIINLKEEPDPNDRVEFKLATNISAKKLTTLEDKIKSFLKDETRFENDCTIVVEDIGDGTKMAIHYQIHTSFRAVVTHSLCLEKKRKQKSVLLKRIAEFIEEVEPDTRTTPPPTAPKTKKILQIPLHTNNKLTVPTLSKTLSKCEVSTHPGPTTG